MCVYVYERERVLLEDEVHDGSGMWTVQNTTHSQLPVRVDGVLTSATSSMSRLVSSGGSPMRARNGAK